MREDSQNSYSFGNIQNVGETELSKEKILCFIGERFHIWFSYIYIYMYIYIYIYISAEKSQQITNDSILI